MVPASPNTLPVKIKRDAFVAVSSIATPPLAARTSNLPIKVQQHSSVLIGSAGEPTSPQQAKDAPNRGNQKSGWRLNCPLKALKASLQSRESIEG